MASRTVTGRLGEHGWQSEPALPQFVIATDMRHPPGVAM